LGVEVAEPPLCLITDPSAVPSNIFRQALNPGPRIREATGIGMDGPSTGERWRQLDESLGDDDGHRVQVAGQGFKPKSLGFERD
jgi:hypothetical protein